jgi:hypothetical protein
MARDQADEEDDDTDEESGGAQSQAQLANILLHRRQFGVLRGLEATAAA